MIDTNIYENDIQIHFAYVQSLRSEWWKKNEWICLINTTYKWIKSRKTMKWKRKRMKKNIDIYILLWNWCIYSTCKYVMELFSSIYLNLFTFSVVTTEWKSKNEMLVFELSLYIKTISILFKNKNLAFMNPFVEYIIIW